MSRYLRTKQGTKIDLDRTTREKLEGEFQREFFEAALENDPANLGCLIRLGDLYTRQGFYQKGLEIDLRLVDICPKESTFHYNLACSYSLLGQLEESLEALETAIEHGYDEWEHLNADDDLANLRNHPRYEELIARFSADDGVNFLEQDQDGS